MKTKKLVTILLVLGSFIAVTGTSSADVISYSDNVSFDHDQVVSLGVYNCPPDLTYTFLSDTVSLSQFDPSLGILDSVELIVESDIDVETHYYFPYNDVYTDQWWYSDVIGSVNGLGLQATISQDHEHTTIGQGYHDHVFSIDGTASESPSSDLAGFIGTGLVDVAITGDDKLCAWWNYYNHIDTDTYGTVTATLVYNYTPDTPAAMIDIDPDTLHLSSKGKWVTCYIELPEGYDVMDIDGSTVTLEGIPAHIGKEGWARAVANTSNIMDHDDDGILKRMVKFDRSAVQNHLIGLGATGEVELTVTGKLIDETLFEGIDVIRVVNSN